MPNNPRSALVAVSPGLPNRRPENKAHLRRSHLDHLAVEASPGRTGAGSHRRGEPGHTGSGLATAPAGCRTTKPLRFDLLALLVAAGCAAVRTGSGLWGTVLFGGAALEVGLHDLEVRRTHTVTEGTGGKNLVERQMGAGKASSMRGCSQRSATGRTGRRHLAGRLDLAAGMATAGILRKAVGSRAVVGKESCCRQRWVQQEDTGSSSGRPLRTAGGSGSHLGCCMGTPATCWSRQHRSRESSVAAGKSGPCERTTHHVQQVWDR